jgi:cellulose synthase/poly-beta-1,6-N-acetylglucosamine synthase-like glycosyltransferase
MGKNRKTGGGIGDAGTRAAHSKRLIDDIVRAKKRMGRRFPRFAVFIVAYNAATTLKRTLERIPQEIYDILECVYVIDDFSKDQTYEISRRLAKDERFGKPDDHRADRLPFCAPPAADIRLPVYP